MKIIIVNLFLILNYSIAAFEGTEITLLKDVEMKSSSYLGEEVYFNKKHLVSVKRPGVLSLDENGSSMCNISLRSNSLHKKVFPKGSRFTITKSKESYPSLGDFMMASSSYLIETESNEFPGDTSLSIDCFSNRVLVVRSFNYKKVKKTLRGLFLFEK
ncbi:hypothetical protein [Halobacteriovorax sp. HLS]|uniref:hypothetical protein n=1 Tax=Halobacteriovorax sp. HLS TaxID=2234000 RepID=UPI000FD952DC|nr:hypothetical protein [Halobacteriovorax sp. HLS]